MFSSLLTRHIAYLPNHAALPGDNDGKSTAALRANDIISRLTPLMIRLTPTNVPIAQLELDGHCK
jgi:hypothetical protein